MTRVMSKSQRGIVNNQDGFLFAAISYIFDGWRVGNLADARIILSD
jgi:hypothetical protein